MRPASIDAKFKRPPPAFAAMSVGLFGGSFNPPHEGHLNASLNALKRLSLDQLWWLISPGNPLKSQNELAELRKRLSASETIADHPRIIVTAIEDARPSFYSVDTLRWLKSRFAGVNFVWIMGADNLAIFHNWKSWREIFSLVPIAVIDRPGFRYKALSSKAAKTFQFYRVEESDSQGLAALEPPAWTFLTVPLSPLSSTNIRNSPNSLR